jgi:hypothetical protein
LEHYGFWVKQVFHVAFLGSRKANRELEEGRVGSCVKLML